MNKKRREKEDAKTPEQRAAKSQRQRVWNTTPATRESKRSYKRTLKEFRANNLHPASITKPSPHWTPDLIFPESSSAKPISSGDMVILELSPMPIWFPPHADQSPTIETPELRAARTIHRHRVTSGERTSVLTRQNQVFEKTIARNTIGVHNEDFTGTDATPESDVIDSGAAGVDAAKPHPMDQDAPEINIATEARTSAVGHDTTDACL